MKPVISDIRQGMPVITPYGRGTVVQEIGLGLYTVIIDNGVAEVLETVRVSPDYERIRDSRIKEIMDLYGQG
jgi:hypothetical protein